MRIGGNFLKRVKWVAIMLVFCIIYSFSSISAVGAESHSFYGIGEYTMGGFETINVAEQRALQNAEQNALEQAGVFVSSFTETENLKITKDEIRVITSGIIKISQKNLIKSTTSLGDIHITAKIMAIIDTDEIKTNLKNTQQLEQLAIQYHQLEEQNKAQAQELDRLKAVEKSNGKLSKNELEAKGHILDNAFLANSKIKEAQILYRKTDFQTANYLLAEAIQIDPDNFMAYTVKALVDISRNDKKAGIYDATKALEFNKSLSMNSMLYTVRGLCYLLSRQPELALVDFNQSIAIDPHNAYVYADRGRAYLQLKQLSKAMDDLNRSIALAPNQSQAYSYRAICLGLYGDYKGSVADLTRVINGDEHSAETYALRAHNYIMLHEYSLAINDFNQAIMLKAEPEYYINRGQTYAKMGRQIKAIQDTTKAICLDANNAKAYFYRAKLYIAQKDYHLALDDINSYLALDPSNSKAKVLRDNLRNII